MSGRISADGRLADLARRVTGRGEPRLGEEDRVAALEVAVAENSRLAVKLERQVHALEQSCLALLQDPTGETET